MQGLDTSRLNERVRRTLIGQYARQALVVLRSEILMAARPTEISVDQQHASAMPRQADRRTNRCSSLSLGGDRTGD